MKITVLKVGPLETNCYLVQPNLSQKLYVIDPGGDSEVIIQSIKAFTYSQAIILLTHAHVDHIAASGKVAQALQLEEVYIASEDHEYYYSPYNALPPYIAVAKNLPKAVEFPINSDFEVLRLPGHTPGGRGFLFRNEAVLFAGDTIFASSIGNTSFPGGDYPTLIQSIKTQILTLPDNITIYPGHGPKTTVGAERAHNPYLQ